MALELIYFYAKDPQPLALGLDPKDRKNKDRFNRLRHYFRWLKYHDHSWLRPDLDAYRKHLLTETRLSPTSAKIHLSTIRVRYQALLDLPESDNVFSELVSPFVEEPAIQEIVLEIRARIRAAIELTHTTVDTEEKPIEYVRLNNSQVNELIRRPGLRTLVGQRDTAAIALMSVTGLRAAEVSALYVEDIRHETVDGTALKVVNEQDRTVARYVPYGAMIGVLELVEFWIKQAGISSGPLFRPFRSISDEVRDSRLSSRTVELIVTSYPITVDGAEVVVTPMMLRRTYASRLYEEGVSIGKLQEYLGVGPKAVLDYIGDTPRKASATTIPNLYALDPDEIQHGIAAGELPPFKSADSTAPQDNETKEED